MKPKPALSAEAKKAQKTPLSKIFAFFGAIFFVALVLGGTFITFVILNTNDVSDVRFFSNLGIRLQDINDFLSGIVTFIFSLLLFLFTVVLTISLFRFILTKKVLKKKKLGYGLFSAFMLILTFMTGVLWMTIDQKIKTFPNWGE
jgi:magnesium-transporting ATPase (P-type)